MILGFGVFNFGITDESNQRKTCVAGVPEGARLGVVAPEVSRVAETVREIDCSGSGVVQIGCIFCSCVEFRGGKKGRVVIDNVFLAVVAIGARLADTLFGGKMGVSGLGCSKVLFAGEIAVCLEGGNAGEACNRHAATFAEGRLVVAALDAVFSAKGAEITARAHSPVVEYGHVEKSLLVEHTNQEVSAVGGFFYGRSRCFSRRQQGGNVFCRKGERPYGQGNLLRTQVIGVRKV